jgi:hypothetical protein
VLGKERERVEILVACKLFGLAYTGGKVLPGNNCFESLPQSRHILSAHPVGDGRTRFRMRKSEFHASVFI